MTIFDPITQSQSLLSQLQTTLNSHNNLETNHLLSLLESHLQQIKLNTSSLQQQIIQLQKNQPITKKQIVTDTVKPEIKSGCYIFEGEKGYFCPRCYDQDSNKVATARLNSKLRICPTCRTSIK
jgi:hypothetical protein